MVKGGPSLTSIILERGLVVHFSRYKPSIVWTLLEFWIQYMAGRSQKLPYEERLKEDRTNLLFSTFSFLRLRPQYRSYNRKYFLHPPQMDIGRTASCRRKSWTNFGSQTTYMSSRQCFFQDYLTQYRYSTPLALNMPISYRIRRDPAHIFHTWFRYWTSFCHGCIRFLFCYWKTKKYTATCDIYMYMFLL